MLDHISLPEPKMPDHDLVVVIQLPNGRTNAHWRYRGQQLEVLFQQFVVETHSWCVSAHYRASQSSQVIRVSRQGRACFASWFYSCGQLALQDFVFVAVHRPEEQEETEASRSNSSLRTIKASNSNNKVKNKDLPGYSGDAFRYEGIARTFQQHPFCHQVHSRPRQPLLAT